MPVGKKTYKESDGQAVQVTLVSNYVQDGQVIWSNNWVGVNIDSGDSGDLRAMDISLIERQFTVPTALAVVKGEIVYLTLANRTGNVFADNAYSKTAGAGKIAYFKATADQDGNDMVTGIVLGQLAS